MSKELYVTSMFAVEEITQASQDESENEYETNDKEVARAPIFWSNLAGLMSGPPESVVEACSIDIDMLKFLTFCENLHLV